MDRRTFLGTSCATAGALLAGCLSSTDDPGNQTDSGDGTDGGSDAGAGTSSDVGSGSDGAAGDGSGSDETGSGDGSTGTAATASYEPVAKWAVPADAADDSTYGYSIRARKPRRMLRAEGDGSVNVTQRVQLSTTFDWDYVEPSTLDLVVTVVPVGVLQTGYQVVRGDLDAASIREQFAESAERTGSYEDFDLYGGIVDDSLQEQYQKPRAYGVADGTVIQVGGRFAGRSDGSIDHVERVIDAGTGSGDDVVDQYDALATAASRIEPTGYSALARQDPARETDVEAGTFAGVEAVGASGTFDGRTATRTEVFVHERADAVATEDVEAFLEQRRSYSSVHQSGYDVEGRVVTVESTVDAVVLFQR